jgi:hypothetical protein
MQQRFSKQKIEKELAKQAKGFRAYLIECLKLTFEAHGVCLHIVMKNEDECEVCGKFVPKS